MSCLRKLLDLPLFSDLRQHLMCSSITDAPSLARLASRQKDKWLWNQLGKNIILNESSPVLYVMLFLYCYAQQLNSLLDINQWPELLNRFSEKKVQYILWGVVEQEFWEAWKKAYWSGTTTSKVYLSAVLYLVLSFIPPSLMMCLGPAGNHPPKYLASIWFSADSQTWPY